MDDAPDSPHRVRRRAPRVDLVLKHLHFELELRARGRDAGLRVFGGRQRRARVLEVGGVEVAARVERGVLGVVEEVRRVAVVVGRPLMEVVSEVEGGRVWRGVFEVDDDNLGSG